MSFRAAAAIICITCIFYSTVMRSMTRKKLRDRLFMLMVVITLIDSLTGIITEFVQVSELNYSLKFYIMYAQKYIYYSTHMMLTPLFWLYISVVTDVYYRFKKYTLLIRFFPFIILEIAALTNPLTNFIFIANDDLTFYRGTGLYVAYFVSALYVIFSIYLLLRYWYTMNILQKVAMFYFLGLAIVGTFIQMVFPEIVCELICEALGLLGIMIMIERDDYRLDYKTRANNRGSLVLDMNNLIESGRKFHVICVRVITTELYRRVIGYESFDSVSSQIADFLLDINLDYEVYRTTGGQFFIICKDAEESDIDRTLEMIGERFERSFDTAVGPTIINAKVLCAKCPDELSSTNDILLLQDANVEGTDKTVLKGEDLGFLLRRIEVEKAIVRGINNDSFRVFYQPSYNRETLRINAAEALLTLRDPYLGEIQFSEFISVAEDTGFSEELEFRMIESVFRFIKAGVMKSDMDISCLVLHIMSVQVIKPELVEKVKKYLAEYKVDPELVIFDVSDTVAIQAQDELGYFVDGLIKLGIRVILVNNDPGFLGISHNIIDKVEGVVINVKKLIENMESERAEIILKNRIAMVRQLGKEVIISGIDTRELYDVVRDKDADYIMGDFMSKPVTKNELQTKFWHGEVFYEKK